MLVEYSLRKGYYTTATKLADSSADSNIFVANITFGDEFLHNYSTEILQTSLQIFDIDPENLKSKLTVDTNKQSEEDVVPKNKHLKRDFMLKLPILPYYSVDYTKKNL